MAFFPPGGPSQIVFSFDTTGSMSSILFEVRGRLNDMIQRLQADIPGIKIAVFAHGDYCDEKEFYVTQHIDFTGNVPDLCTFVNEVSGTGGGDTDECYELVLRQVQDLAWEENTQKSLVLIGDAMPHAPDYPLNTQNINWEDEVNKLAEKGVKIYAVQCLEEIGAESFYQQLAEKTGGHHLKLNQFSNIFDFLMAICYREKGTEFLQGYEAEVRARNSKNSLDKDLEGLFGALRDKLPPALTPPSSVGGPEPVPAVAIPGPAAVTPAPGLAPAPLLAPAPGPAPIVNALVPAKRPKFYRPRALKTRKALKKIQQKRDLKRYKSLKKLNRGKVPHSNFLLNNLIWTPWKMIICGEPDGDYTGHWRKRNGTSSYRRKLAFRETHQRAIYEFAIQNRKGARRRVVFFKVLDGFDSPQRWETKLLRDCSVRNEINAAVSSGCSVFVRRAALRRTDSVQDCKRKLSNLYNYEWIKRRSKISS